MTVRTWQVEAAVVLAVLSGVAVLTGNTATEWLGTGAVFLSFSHGQVADRMAERQAAMEKPDVHCWWKARYYFVGKELLWVAYFLAHRSYAALVGCALFLLYPVWRSWWRSVHVASVEPVRLDLIPCFEDLAMDAQGSVLARACLYPTACMSRGPRGVCLRRAGR